MKKPLKKLAVDRIEDGEVEVILLSFSTAILREYNAPFLGTREKLILRWKNS